MLHEPPVLQVANIRAFTIQDGAISALQHESALAKQILQNYYKFYNDAAFCNIFLNGVRYSCYGSAIISEYYW